MQMVVNCEETMTTQRLHPRDLLVQLRQWLIWHRELNTRHFGDSDPSGHPHGYAGVVIPEWDVRQRLDEIDGSLAIPDQLERNAGIRQFYVKDHPEANSRTAVKGEHGYTLRFPLQDGTELQVLCGEETLTRFSDMIGRMLIDNDAEAK
jgi:hypothetical protein